VSGIVSLAGLRKGNGPDATKAILDAIPDLREFLDRRLAVLEEGLDRILETQAETLRAVRSLFDQAEQNAWSEAQAIDAVRKDQRLAFIELRRRSVDTLLGDMARHVRAAASARSDAEVVKSARDFAHHALVEARKADYAGAPKPTMSELESYCTQRSQPDMWVGALPALCELVGVSLARIPSLEAEGAALANPIEWARGTRAFLELLVAHPNALNADSSLSKDIQEIYRTGRDLQLAIESASNATALTAAADTLALAAGVAVTPRQCSALAERRGAKTRASLLTEVVESAIGEYELKYLHPWRATQLNPSLPLSPTRAEGDVYYVAAITKSYPPRGPIEYFVCRADVPANDPLAVAQRVTIPAASGRPDTVPLVRFNQDLSFTGTGVRGSSEVSARGYAQGTAVVTQVVGSPHLCGDGNGMCFNATGQVRLRLRPQDRAVVFDTPAAYSAEPSVAAGMPPIPALVRTYDAVRELVDHARLVAGRNDPNTDGCEYRLARMLEGADPFVVRTFVGADDCWPPPTTGDDASDRQSNDGPQVVSSNADVAMACRALLTISAWRRVPPWPGVVMVEYLTAPQLLGAPDSRSSQQSNGRAASADVRPADRIAAALASRLRDWLVPDRRAVDQAIVTVNNDLLNRLEADVVTLLAEAAAVEGLPTTHSVPLVDTTMRALVTLMTVKEVPFPSET